MDKNVKNYYLKKMYGGRTKLARAVDTISFSILTFAILYVLFSSIFYDNLLSLILSIITIMLIIITYIIINDIKFKRFIINENKRIEKNMIFNSLLLLNEEEFIQCVQKYVQANEINDYYLYALQKVDGVCADDVLCAYRKAINENKAGIIIASINPASDKKAVDEMITKIVIAKNNFIEKIVVVCADDIINACKKSGESRYFENISEDDINKYIEMREAGERWSRKKVMSSPFSIVPYKKYFIVAAIIFAVSFLGKYSLYYRIISYACLTFGIIARKLGKNEYQIKK